jgi:hypothetical protein
MTFDEWRATRQVVDSIDDALGTTCGEGPGFVYAGGGFIERSTGSWPTDCKGRYCLTIENYSRQSDDLEELERDLWNRWTSDEVENSARDKGRIVSPLRS